MGWVQTYTGKRVDPFNLVIEDIDIRDIAHSLALQCRFNGHCKEFYSVAEHSCRVHDITPDIYQAYALLHDAAEAYLGDTPTPIKAQMFRLKEREQKISDLIVKKFRLLPVSQHIGNTIHSRDKMLLATEARDLMGDPKDWETLPPSLGKKIVPWPWQMAKREFLIRAEKLGLI